MKNFVVLSLACLMVISLCLTVGCGPKRPDGLPDLYPTEITITCDGKPVPNAGVTLIPDAKLNFVISGSTDKNGVAVIRAQFPTGNYPGAPAGDQKVRVIKTINIGSEESPAAANALKTKFSNISTSGFSISVGTSEKNAATFEVEADEQYADRVFE